MDRHADYAAAIAIRQDLLQRLVRVLYHADQIPHTIASSMGWVTLDLFLDIPKVVCSAQNGNRLALELTAWGSLAVSLSGGAKETRSVLVTATVLASPQLALQNASLYFSMDASKATLDAYQVTPFAGGAFSAAVQALLNSPLCKALIETVLRQKLASIQQLAPPLNVSFLGDVANSSNTTLTARVLDGALAIGLDVDAEGIKTTGNPQLLSDVTAGNDLGMWQNPVALPVFMKRIYTQVTAAVQGQGATLDDFSVTLEEGHYHLAGAASNAEGSVSFSMNAVPHLVRPGYVVDLGEDEYGEPCFYSVPDREELWFEAKDVQVDVQRAWWVTFLEVLGGFLTLGLGALIVETFVDMARNNILAGIGSSSHEKVADRNQYFTFENTSEPLMRLRLETYQCHTEGAFTGITLRGQFRKPLLEGDHNCFIEQVLTNPPKYKLQLPFDVKLDDPQMRVRWTVRRNDTNEVLLVQEGQVTGRLSLSLGLLAQTMLQVEAFTVECRLYRALGASATDFFNDSCRLSITDTLDRSHPYVRWRHWVFGPIVRVEADKSHTVAGLKLTERRSVIHRTDYPGRCKMVARYSLGSPAPPRTPFGHAVPQPLVPLPDIEYLDSLPFDRAALVANRAKLCDYCFFGGPTKTTPLIP
jgi:hypothetical protein